MLSQLLVCLPLFFPVLPPVQGDRVETKSGEVFQGKVVTMEGGKLEFDSGSAGIVKIPFGELKSLSTDKAIEVLLKDGTTRKYHFTEGNTDLSFDSIASLNPKVPDPFSGAAAIGLLRAKGNTDRLSFSLQANAAYDFESSRISSNFEWIYGEDRDPATNSSYISQRRISWDVQYDYTISKRLYAYALGTSLGDLQSEIDYRYTLGAGLGYSVIKEAQHEVNGELGVAERWERKLNQPSNEYFNIRIAANGKHDILDDSKLNWDIEYLPSVDENDVYLINFNIGTAFKVWGDLLSTLTYSLNYDNTPAPGKDRTDHRLIWGLGLSF